MVTEIKFIFFRDRWRFAASLKGCLISIEPHATVSVSECIPFCPNIPHFFSKLVTQSYHIVCTLFLTSFGQIIPLDHPKIAGYTITDTLSEATLLRDTLSHPPAHSHTHYSQSHKRTSVTLKFPSAALLHMAQGGGQMATKK